LVDIVIADENLHAGFPFILAPLLGALVDE
jgi:hypothetical protein